MRLIPTILAVALALALTGCEDSPARHLRIENGDPDRGRALIRSYGCGACHTIEGIREARGVVGPPLTAFAKRTILAGEYPNTPVFLVQWLISPPALAPRTAMPDMGISDAEARDMASYLFTLGAAGADVYPNAPSLPLAPRGESAAR